MLLGSLNRDRHDLLVLALSSQVWCLRDFHRDFRMACAAGLLSLAPQT